MTARTCETCEHLQTYWLDRVAPTLLRLVPEMCDFDGASVPCNESGVCGRWSTREGEEEEE